MERNKSILTFFQKHRFYVTLIICLLVFISAISMLITSFNKLISSHDQYLSGEICVLITEKMNNSIRSMTVTTRSIASVLSAQNFKSPDEIYSTLKDNEDLKFTSIGFLDEDFNIYGTDTEKYEFQKWDLIEYAKKANPVGLSIPYRSSTTGQPVITLFSEFNYDTNHKGYLFMTYNFKELETIAKTESLENDIEISLMDGQSANQIQCTSSDSRAVGNWSNAYLTMQELVTTKGKLQFRNWLQQMAEGTDDIGLTYSDDNIIYTIHCTEIETMPGWYVVVRIPSNALSTTMNTFRNYVLMFLAALLLIVIILLSSLYVNNKRETATLEDLSAHDPLTDLLNRRAFDSNCQQMLSLNTNLALIFFDIDFFKHINDQYGHDVGDKILVDFSIALANSFQDIGIIGRFGGDEFVILTKIESKESLSKILNETLAEVRSIKIPNSDKHISVSAGVALYPDDATDLSTLKKCADNALYNAKEAGRNEFCWYRK